MKKSWMLYALLWAVIGTASAGLAQNPAPPPPAVGFNPGAVYAKQFMIMTAGPMMESKIVTGAPYSAEAKTEIRQTLSDGNHIDHKETSWIYRDSAGRIRREKILSILGPLSTQGKMVTLFDPVAHATYVLDPARKTAYKMPALRKGMTGRASEVTTMGMAGGPKREFHVQVMGRGVAGGPMAMAMPGEDFIYRGEEVESEPQSVSLGTRTIEGVAADGTRTTMVIPAGKIGNEKPITIVSERWYSPKLLTYVMTRKDDPRFGLITYQLTNLKLGEPAADLFKVPASYKIEQGPLRPRRFLRAQPPAGNGPDVPRP